MSTALTDDFKGEGLSIVFWISPVFLTNGLLSKYSSVPASGPKNIP
jgi:hypothetical protein